MKQTRLVKLLAAGAAGAVALSTTFAQESSTTRADEILRYFMSELPQVRKMLWTDIDAAYEGDPAA